MIQKLHLMKQYGANLLDFGPWSLGCCSVCVMCLARWKCSGNGPSVWPGENVICRRVLNAWCLFYYSWCNPFWPAKNSKCLSLLMTCKSKLFCGLRCHWLFRSCYRTLLKFPLESVGNFQVRDCKWLKWAHKTQSQNWMTSRHGMGESTVPLAQSRLIALWISSGVKWNS